MKTERATYSATRKRKIAATVFGAVAVAVSMSVALIIFAWFVATFAKDISSADSGMFMTLLVMLLATMYVTIPPLINSRFGWKTVVATYLVQSVVVALFLGTTMILATMMFRAPSSPTDDTPCAGVTCRRTLD